VRRDRIKPSSPLVLFFFNYHIVRTLLCACWIHMETYQFLLN
jgi:hypothetical protein